MANVHLVTGYAGSEHVTSADHGAFNAAIVGTGQYVLEKGNKFAITVVSNNLVRIADGEILMQGRHIRLPENTYVDLTIENGTQGYNRNDLVVARYTKDAETNKEECNLVVIKGTPVTGVASDPQIVEGDLISAHDILNEMPLFRIPISGLTVGDPRQRFSVFPSIETAESKLSNLTGSVSTLQANLEIHTHDSRYYTESEVDAMIAQRYLKSNIEQGTWTPVPRDGSGWTIKKHYCTYTLIEDMCIVTFYINATGNTGSEQTSAYYLRFGGIPFAPSTSARWYGGGGHMSGCTVKTGFTFDGFIIDPDEQRIVARSYNASTSAGEYCYVTNGGSDIYASGTIAYTISGRVS